MLDWSGIELVVFDVDGTLYDQKRLRRMMLGRLLGDAVRHRSLETLRVLRVFRQVREALGEEEGADFLALQYSRTGQALRCDAERVRELTEEWMERRPLRLLADCRLAHVDRLFEGLRACGKQVAVLSDYPAADKLQAMGLQAHAVICATDPEIARLKPDPSGLRAILDRTGISPDRALMVGDRFDRDAEVARRAGVRALIRSRKPHPQVQTFRRYDDPVFHPVLAPAALPCGVAVR
jgi:FMN phosphatase YigB (HAD superfamily)